MTTTTNHTTETLATLAAAITWHSDNGHGWLQIDGHRAPALMLLARECSTGYDYAHDGSIYLEEDCSVGVFARTISARYNIDPDNVRATISAADDIYTNGDSPVRTYSRLAAGRIGKNY